MGSEDSHRIAIYPALPHKQDLAELLHFLTKQNNTKNTTRNKQAQKKKQRQKKPQQQKQKCLYDSAFSF